KALEMSFFGSPEKVSIHFCSEEQKKPDTLAAKVSLAIQKLFLHNRVLRLYFYSRFGLSSVETREWSQDKTVFAFKTRVTIEPSLATSGIGGSITGAHYDYVWCDDIVASEDRYSAAERERTKHFVYELANVIDPRGSRLYTGTPWHRDDAFSVLPPAKRYPIGTVTVPDIDDAWIAQTRALLPPSLWAANYELRFVEDYQPEFPPLQFTDAVPAGERVWYIDPAFGGADHTAVAEGLRCGDKYYVTWLFYKRQSIGDLYDYLQEEFWARGIKVVYYEENSAQRLIGAELRRRQIPCRGVRNV
ncbi:MAG: hypothetical protein RML34_11685, partial [Leptospiraceae bacterium]|nr:hypothetical protein [Leptospiraceae bacterium]